MKANHKWLEGISVYSFATKITLAHKNKFCVTLKKAWPNNKAINTILLPY